MIKLVKKLISKVFDFSYSKNKQNITRQLEIRALDSTCAYIELKMFDIKPQKTVFDVLDIAMQSLTIEGLICEFGVFSGKSINYIASKFSQTVHGFDSFEGLPEFWRDGFDKGTFEVEHIPKVKENISLHKGWFNETLPIFVQENEGKISLLHVDCDLYSSTKTVFEYLGNRIVKGTVIVFDEYFNYPMWEHGEFKAFQEFISVSNLHYRYLTYNTNHEQVAVVIE